MNLLSICFECNTQVVTLHNIPHALHCCCNCHSSLQASRREGYACRNTALRSRRHDSQHDAVLGILVQQAIGSIDGAASLTSRQVRLSTNAVRHTFSFLIWLCGGSSTLAMSCWQT